MRRELRVSVTEEEYAEVVAYVVRKKRWREVSHFVRDCVFQAISRNPPGRHVPVRGGDATEGTDLVMGWTGVE